MTIQEIGINIDLSYGTFTNTIYKNNKLQVAERGLDADGNVVYMKSGSWESEPILVRDKIRAFKNVVKTFTKSGEASYKFFTRTSENGMDWSEYVETTPEGEINSEPAKFAQIKIEIYPELGEAEFSIDDFANVNFENKLIEATSDGLKLRKNIEHEMKRKGTDEGGVFEGAEIKKNEIKKVDSVSITRDTYKKLGMKLFSTGINSNGFSDCVYSRDGDHLLSINSRGSYVNMISDEHVAMTGSNRPSTLANSNADACAYSPDNKFFAVMGGGAINIFKRLTNTMGYQKLPNPSALPATGPRSCCFSNNSMYYAVGGANEITIYSINGDTFTKLSSPSSSQQPVGAVVDCVFSQDDNILFAVTQSRPYLFAWRRNGNVFSALTIDSGFYNEMVDVNGCAVSPDNKKLVIGTSKPPFVHFYSINGFTFTKDVTSSTITSTAYKCKFKGDYLAVGLLTDPNLAIFVRENGEYKQLEVSGEIPSRRVYSVAFHPTKNRIALATNSSTEVFEFGEPEIQGLLKTDNSFKKYEIPPLLDAIPQMTSNTSPQGRAFSSSSYSASYEAWKAFNKINENEGFATSNGSGGVGHLGYEFPEPTLITTYEVVNTGDSYTSRMPKKWTFEGSNNLTNWEVLDSQENQIWYRTYYGYKYTILTPKKFKAYRLNWTENNGYSSYTAVNQLIMYSRDTSFPKLTNVNLSEENLQKDTFIDQGMSDLSVLDRDEIVFVKDMVDNGVPGEGRVFKEKLDLRKLIDVRSLIVRNE